jgi:hypothetical protein
VKTTADRVAVLGQIEWIEFSEAPVLSFHRRSFSKRQYVAISPGPTRLCQNSE